MNYSKHTFLILILFLLPATSISATDDMRQDSPSYSFWIGIHNAEVFYEYKYLNNVLQKVNDGQVSEIKDGNATRLGLWTDALRNSTKEKEKTRELLREKYRKALLLYQYSIIDQSDDRRYIAYTSEYNDKSISVISLLDKRIVRIDSMGKRVISDILWLNGSREIVLLTRSEKTGCQPHEILSAIAGHPVPHNNFYLEFYTHEGRLVRELRVMEDIKYGLGVLIR